MNTKELYDAAATLPDFVMDKEEDWNFGGDFVEEHSVLENAILLASLAHGCQRDKSGRPYILHCLRVMMSCKTDDEKVVGVLHDVLEDTEMTGLQLLEEDIPLYLVEAIVAITHDKKNNEPRKVYYDRVRANPLALIVKEYDLDDNSDEKRLAELDEPTRKRLKKKYADAYQYLYGFVPEHLQCPN